MSFELNILVLQQENVTPVPLKFPFEIQIELKEQGLQEIFWPFMSSSKGVWYTVGIEEDGLYSALPILESDFETVDDSDLPYWVKDEEVKSNLTTMRIVDIYEEKLFDLMSYLIEQSPLKTIMLMSRYQGGDKEIVCGVFSLNEFIDLHAQGKVLFNVCYIIRQVK